MKDFLSRIFKKKTATPVPSPSPGAKKEEGTPPPDSVAAADSKNQLKPETKTEPKPELKSDSKKEPEAKVKADPKSQAVPAKEDSKPLPPPVLVPLYDKKEKEPAPAPMVPASLDPQLPPHQHLPFEGELQEVIQKLVDDLSDVYPQTFDQWEDGFRRDENPEQEIAAWTHVAAVLRAMSGRYNLGLSKKQECFAVLIACFTGSRETVRHRSKPHLLSDEQFDQAVKYFYEGGH